MKTIIVSRHPAGVQWIREQLALPESAPLALVQQWDPGEHLVPGKSVRVVGTLPLHLAAGVCGHEQSEFWFLVLDIPAALRGVELTGTAFRNCRPRLARYLVERAP